MSDSLNQTGRNSLFERLVEAGPDAIVIVGGTGKIVLVNAQTERLFGYGRNELIGRDVAVLVPEHLTPADPEAENARLSNPETRSTGAGTDLYGRRRDGTKFPVEIGLTPLKTEEGTLTIETIRDITDRKRNERALQEQARLLERRVEERTAELSRLNAGLEKANRMKDDFIARISHELRTPLTSITGWVHMLEEGELGESKRKRAMEVIDRNLTLQAQLINDLLNASLIVSGKIHLDLQTAYPAPSLNLWSSAAPPQCVPRVRRKPSHCSKVRHAIS